MAQAALYGAALAGVAVGLTRRLAESYQRFDGPVARLNRAGQIEGGLDWHPIGAYHQLRSLVESQGYCFQIDLALRVAPAGMRVAEVPITFTERTAGAGKMNRSIVLEALRRVTTWGLCARFGRNLPDGKYYVDSE